MQSHSRRRVYSVYRVRLRRAQSSRGVSSVRRLLPFDKAQGGELVEPRKRRYGSTELVEVRSY